LVKFFNCVINSVRKVEKLLVKLPKAVLPVWAVPAAEDELLAVVDERVFPLIEWGPFEDHAVMSKPTLYVFAEVTTLDAIGSRETLNCLPLALPFDSLAV
jgi:hypothetical protein